MNNSPLRAKNPLRVLHILRAPRGGAFRHVCDLARAQAKTGALVGLAYDGPPEDRTTQSRLTELKDDLSLGLTAVRIPRKPGIGDVAAFRQLKSLSRKTRPTIIHGHGAKGAAYSRLLAPAVSAKAVCTPHGGVLHYGLGSPAGMAYLTIERLLKPRTDGMIFESRYACDVYKKQMGKMSFPSIVVPNGLNEEDFEVPRARNARYDFAFVGELRTLKGVFVLVDAVRRALKFRRFKLLIVGSGPEEQRLRSRISELGLDDAIDVSRPIHPARRVFSLARCLVTPSIKESMPYIVLEAIAAGMPIITTAVGGIPEIFGPSAYQLLPAGNSEALADRLVRVQRKPEEAQAAAESLRYRIQTHLSVSEMESSIRSFYASL